MKYSDLIENGNDTAFKYNKEVYFRDNLPFVIEDCKNNIIKNNDNIEINTIFCNIKIEQFVSVFNNHQKLRISINHPENTYRYSFNMQ